MGYTSVLSNSNSNSKLDVGPACCYGTRPARTDSVQIVPTSSNRPVHFWLDHLISSKQVMLTGLILLAIYIVNVVVRCNVCCSWCHSSAGSWWGFCSSSWFAAGTFWLFYVFLILMLWLPCATFYVSVILTYLLSCTLSESWPIIGSIFAFHCRVPLFNALVGDEPQIQESGW